jgi:hypothetical protein
MDGSSLINPDNTVHALRLGHYLKTIAEDTRPDGQDKQILELPNHVASQYQRQACVSR